MAYLPFLLLIFFVVVALVYLVRSLRHIDETNRAIAKAKSHATETVITSPVEEAVAETTQTITAPEPERRHYTLLKISAPKNNAKSPLAAEHMFAALHGMYRKGQLEQEHFSFEISATTLPSAPKTTAPAPAGPGFPRAPPSV